MPVFFRLTTRLLAFVALLGATATFAHTGSTAYIETTSNDSDVALTWRIALRDLDLLVELDADRNGTLSWDEVQARAAAVQAFAA